MPIRNRRVFVSFDFDNDRALYNFIVGQAKEIAQLVGDIALEMRIQVCAWAVRGQRLHLQESVEYGLPSSWLPIPMTSSVKASLAVGSRISVEHG